MTHHLAKQMLASVLAGVLALGSFSLPAYAVDSNSGTTDAGKTIAGAEETVKVSSDLQDGREINFNENWKFYLGTSSTAQNPSFDDSSWKSVTLPHDFSISQSYTTSGEAESGFLPGGTGWYRKTFVLPESYAGKTLVINFDGVYSDAYVYVNGTQLGENHYGYTSFAFDISDYVTCDGSTENVIAVKAVNNIPSSRWYSGSGIYRDVTLIATDPVHVERYGTKVTTPDIASGTGTVSTEVTVKNDSNTAAEVTVRNTVYTSDGNQVSESAETSVTVNAGATATATSEPVVSKPELWSTDSPTMYYVSTELLVDGSVVDTYDTEFGFRYFSFDSDTGFYLNGEAVKLNGVCMHHDQGALGSAAAYDAMYRQLVKMKDMGVNAIRTSHNPADEDFIDICNELGLLVMEEAFDGWSVSKNGNSNDFGKYFNTSLSSNQILGGNSSMTWAEYAVKSMVSRDRNDPSIILWSLGNEIQEGASADSAFPTIAQNLIDWIEEEDTTRPTTIGSNQRTTSGTLGSVHSVVSNNGGVVGFNYASSSDLSSMHSAYGAILSAETSSAVNSRGIYSSQANASNVDGKYHLTSYDTSKVSWGITAHDSIWNTMTLDYVAGEFVWTGWDYLGEPTPWNGTGSGDSGRGCIPNSSYFGIVDTAGFEKDTYYLYRSQWKQDDNTLHLVTAWDSDNMLTNNGKTPVVVYSNAPKVELYRNGMLIGTATRTVNTTNAGHIYYTYTTSSSDSSICEAVSASGSSSLYATFNVVYEAGTISAKAYDESGKEITATSGDASVSTPGTVSKLNVQTDKTEILADGSSLAYISVDVTDADGNLDTTATNTINFSLSGNGEIVGVDNGDQATTDKYQQSSVLTSTTSAKIAAYAGKALVIVRSTKDAGNFTVNVTSSGLTGGSATVQTAAVSEGTAQEGLASYTMVRDYTVSAGTKPELQTTATGTMANGSTVTGTITWEEIPEETYSTAGDYTVKGTLVFDGLDGIDVTCRLHVIANVIAMRNISTATMVNTVPTLPDKVSGVLANGTLSGEFAVTWDDMTADQFATVGDIITVNGIATVIGDTTLPVTASIRVAEEVNTESTNVASSATLSEDCASTSDNLGSITDGVTSNASDTNARWTNYNNRNTSSTASITFTWATAQLISSVNLYYFTDNYSASLPSNVKFEYSLNGTDFTEIGYEDVTPTGGFTKTEYVFNQVINPVALRVTFTEQSGHCVGLTEAEVMTYAGKLEYNSSAALSGISVDGTVVENFAADTLTYEAAGSDVTASSDVNAGITILPAQDNVVRILTVSEDGTDARTYAVTLASAAACDHANTEVRDAKAATCTEAGYTGDEVCTVCGEIVKAGETIAATGHTIEVQNAKEPTCTEAGYTGDEVCTVCGEIVKAGETIAATGHTTEVRNAKEATCTEEGYTGDTYCTECGELVKAGSTIAAKGHSWDNGVETTPATETEDGVMTYTCTVCGETKTETIPALGTPKVAPTVTVAAAQGTGGKIALTGTFVDYENADKYYDVTAHGLVYYSAAKLGTRTLTVNTPGRTRVNFSKYTDEGSFTYSMKPAYSNTRYVVRAFLEYTNDAGRTAYIYSNPITVSYDTLAQ
ncbi:glycoside hydrolase family 2 TIM barrel-domain containing protein [Butyricicoccus sp.]|uniref:glycoside hydrolase family 2 TIM barrel-domain containing protein n=1 Tax=Butyricicoccus sp. TaxID=2049021 RepID=UPI003F14B28E